jgi:hypothetical protein
LRVQLTLANSIAASDDAVFRELNGESVVLNLESGMYYGLDEVGTRVWQLAAPGATLAQVLECVTDEFEVDRAIAEHDVLELAGTLIDKGLWIAR